ncbi:thioesterase family protein [Rhodococcus sp. IEGM 1381]|uniref:acyl-CoA thioesterase n=1 Tax=Rhodococcus sp. IEGM 1381 TaxID=3047085 RepID=UPI0024B77612|nr:acyl-CoA thioesterase domain-containing protein [Rhodococcus sp. IEGM 1381]MDI9896890.1 thioesterase family protein [Rhodococcus sp. IEGM 1381]
MTTSLSSAELLKSLDLESRGENAFAGHHQVIPSGRAYGGEVVAQAVVAAMNTVADDRSIHSFHGYFLRPGDVHTETDWTVDRVRDGRGFSARAVTGSQNGKAIFSGQASFHIAAAGVAHHEPMPTDLPAPEDLPSVAEVLGDADVRDAHYWAHDRNFDIRHSPSPVYVTADGERTRRQVVWLKAYDRLPDDPNIHRAALAYLCDYTLLEPVLRNNGVSWSDDGLMTASLDHAMWWHNDGRVDDWIALVQESPAASGGLGLAQGRIYTRDGVLLASVAQEGLVSLP